MALTAMDDSLIGRLREALAAAGWTVSAADALIGTMAVQAMQRNETVPAERATRDGSALATLTRLWTLQRDVSLNAAEHALPGLVDALCVHGLLARDVGRVRALVDVQPYGDESHDWWVVADLTPGLDGRQHRVRPEHVLGISSASTSLAQLAVRPPIGRALDLGTGCGVQSLHLSSHADHVLATDVNDRALAMARITTALNEVDVEFRTGSLFDPVRGEEFDLILTNPPFVVSPGTGERLVYRDSGLPGDEVVRRVVTQAPTMLAPGGWCQVLANWVQTRSQTWQERLTGWLEPGGCDAWVVQRELVDPARYVEMWLADAGLRGAPDYLARYDTWLAWLDEQGIEAIGFGWLSLRRRDRDDRRAGASVALRLEEWPWDLEQPIGPTVAAWGGVVAGLAQMSDADMSAARLRRAAGVVQETVGEPGAADPERITVRQLRGLRRARVVDTVEAALIGACDGDLSVGAVLDAVAQLLQRDERELRAAYVPVVRELVADGYLLLP